MHEEILKKIKSTGYWKIVLRPTEYNENLISDLQSSKELIRESKISLRGWDYPHIDNSGIIPDSQTSISSTCNWPEGPAYELWRFHKTGQFEHYFALREDLRIKEEKIASLQDWYGTSANRFLSILSTLYTITEVFEFAKGLYSDITGVDEIEVIIEIHGVKDRCLIFWDNLGRYLSKAYCCNFESDVISIKKDPILIGDLLMSSAGISLSITLEIFKYFDWENPSIEVFREDQKKFLERRI